MPQNKSIIRVGDTVRVLNPVFVKRVGYQLSFEDAYDLVSSRDEEKIIKAIEVLTSVDYKALQLTLKWEYNKGRTSQLFDKIARALAYEEVAKTMKTGNVRSIFTEEFSQYAGKELRVIHKRCVKTGLYDPPYSYQDYDGEWDCFSGGLANEKTHVILEVYPLFQGFYYSHGSKLEIENIHVEKIQTKEV